MSTGSRSMDDDLRALFRYQHEIFISYSRADEPTARELFSSLLRHKVKPFFAPIDLNDAALTTANQWVGVLTQALERSCHYAGLVSPNFLATPWCELELRGFMNLTRSAPARCIQLFPVGVGVDHGVDFIERVRDRGGRVHEHDGAGHAGVDLRERGQPARRVLDSS